MACDLIDMSETTISNLLRAYHEKPSFEYYVYEQNGFTQPFCAIYTTAALAKVYRAFEGNLLKKYSLHDRFESGKPLYLPVEDEKSFTNYNQSGV
jgi:molybdopterin-guanine dinucleotide biosynthesis protein A